MAEATAAKREPDGWPKSLWAKENHLLSVGICPSRLGVVVVVVVA